MDLARVAYETYSITTGGKSVVTGNALPPFDELSPETIGAWAAAADAVVAAYDDESEAGEIA